MWLFVAIFGGIGVVFVIIAAWMLVSTIQFRERAQSTEGVVVELVSRRGSKGGVTYSPVYEFKDRNGGQHRVQSSTSSNPASYDVGERVTVRYDPARPGDARIDGFMDNWFLPLIFGGIGSIFAVIGGAIGMHGVRKRRTRVWLAQHGMRVAAKFTGVVHDTSMKVNGRSPWRLTAQWHHPVTGAIHTFESDSVWFDPGEFVDRDELSVVVDADDPSRYQVDIEFLPKHG
jgi:hypothetical protein